MGVIQTTRVPLGGHVYRSPGRFIRNTSLEDTVASISKAFPAWFLPVIAKDFNKQVPYVMFPGTVVGTLNSRDNGALFTKFGEQTPNVLVPAYMGASYKVVYTASDLSSDDYGGTYDIDGVDNATIRPAVGTSTAVIAKVRPLGITQEPLISRAYFRKFRNLEQQTKINLLVAGKVFRFGAVTDEEIAIFPGDRVCVSDGAGDWDPVNNPATSYPGRWKKVNEAGAYAQEGFVIGRCIERFPIISQLTPVANTMLINDILSTTQKLDPKTLWQDQDFQIMKRIQTVPGLGLQGSGTGGIPSDLSFARADANGVYWGLDIQIGF